MKFVTVSVKCKVWVVLIHGPQLAMVDLDNPDAAWWPIGSHFKISMTDTEYTEYNNMDAGQFLQACQNYWKAQGHFDITNVVSTHVSNNDQHKIVSSWAKQMSIFQNYKQRLLKPISWNEFLLKSAKEKVVRS
ncbi:MAG: hypothetical protein FWE50_02845 [Alphaproteobacteria bacterium]|nr:hypothetical protein [Alphaproteobacteria bacterium]